MQRPPEGGTNYSTELSHQGAAVHEILDLKVTTTMNIDRFFQLKLCNLKMKLSEQRTNRTRLSFVIQLFLEVWIKIKEIWRPNVGIS